MTLIALFIQIPTVQNAISDYVESYLTDQLGTRVSIDYVNIGFPNELLLEGVMVEGPNNDTILYTQRLKGKLSNLISFNENLVINQVSLEGGYIKMLRDTANVWNYTYIIDAFKSEPKNKNQKPLELAIEDVSLTDFKFLLLDQYHGSDMVVGMKRFDVNNIKLDSDKKSIDIGDVEIDVLDMDLHKYAAAYPPGTFKRTIDNTPFNPHGWGIALGKIIINDSYFKTDNDLFPYLPNQFDGSHIDISGINIDVEKLYVHNDSIFGHVNKLTARDKSGIEVRDMQGDVKVSPRISEIKNLYLKTNKSTFHHYFAMEYPRFPAFLNFIHEVELVADIKNATIAIEDIGYFAPNMNRWQHEVYEGSFKGRGTIDKLDVEAFDLRDDVTVMKGAYSIHGIPDMPNAMMKLTGGEVTTTYDELLHLFPQIKDLNLEILEQAGNIAFNGNMEGVFNKLTFDAILKTDLGDVKTTGLTLDYAQESVFKYNGILSSQNLALNKITGNEDLGKGGFEGQINGDGFDIHKNTIQIKGDVWPFEYKGYGYEKFNVDAQALKGLFNGNLKSSDPNALLDMQLSIDYNAAHPVYTYTTQIDWLDLFAIKLTDDTIKFKGHSKGNFAGNSIRNMDGEGTFRDFVAIRDLDTFEFSELAVHSIRNENTNYLNVKSQELNVRLSGQFYLDELGGTVKNIVSYYLPEVLPTPEAHVPGQNFQFEIQSGNLDKYTKLIFPDLKLPQGINIKGSVKENTNDIEISGYAPYFQYKNINVKNLNINSYGDLLGIKINAYANDVSSSDKKMISELDFISTLSKNNLDFSITTTISNEVDRATIYGYAYTNNDSIIFKIKPSELYFNNQRWTIQGDNQITYAQNYLDIDNLKLNSNEQALVVNSADIRTKKGVNNVRLQQINLRPILQMIGMTDLPLDGNVNGSIAFQQLPKSLDAQFDVTTSALKSVEHTLGYIRLKGDFDSEDNTLTLNAPSGMYDENGDITLRGTWSKIGSPEHMLDVQATGKNANFTWAEPFTSELTKGLGGQVSGFLNFKGPFNTPVITGQAHIKDGTFIPLITGVKYTLPDALIDINSHQFIIHSTSLMDDENNIGTLFGQIDHAYFSDVDFNLRMNSPKIKVLDLKENEGENFYGKVYASAQLTLRGLLMDMTMNITATTLAGSKLYIPLTDDVDLNEYEFISFTKADNTQEIEEKVSKKTRLNIYMDALATNDMEAFIIMDPVTNEVINAKGMGNLSLFIPSDGDMRLNGTYTIQMGYYDFILSQLQLLVYKNRFNILDGSSITWDGSITDATVNVKGNTIKRARLYDLITDDIERMGGSIIQSEKNDAMLPQNIIVDMKMTGALLSPDFKFNLSLEETRSIGTYAYQKLQRINADDRELLNQVVSLLVVNQFMPMNGINSSMAVNTGVSNVTEMFSTFASSQLTNFTNKILGIEDLYVNLKYKNYNITDDISSGGLNYLNRNEAGLSVRKNFLSDRIVLDLGGVYDWGRAGFGASGFSDNFALDFRLNYLLTKDGRLRLNVFRNSNFDAVSFQNVGKQGIGINYRKSFNTIYELLNINYRPAPKPIDIRIDENQMIPADSLEVKTDKTLSTVAP